MRVSPLLLSLCAGLWLAGPAIAAPADELPVPRVLTLAPGLSQHHAAPLVLAARRYAGFWNSGDPALAAQALAPDFQDRTLPPGRAQGPSGPLQASAGFRQAVPDLSAEIDEMIVAADRVILRLSFHGHFSGSFGAVQGHGQDVAFRAIDIYRVADGRITDNWHLEDNLALLQQMEAIGK
ncbi:MAG: ester cyclase [Bacteroidota bacterium]